MNSIPNQPRAPTSEQILASRSDSTKSKYDTFESAVSCEDQINEYFNNLQNPDEIHVALRELIIIIEYEPIKFNHTQFHQLLELAIYPNTEHVHNLVMYLLDKIAMYPMSLLDTLVPVDFLSLLFNQIPNINLLTVMANYIPRLTGLPKYLVDYGIFQLLAEYVANPIPNVTSSCITIIKRLARCNFVDVNYIVLLFNIIKNDEMPRELIKKSLKAIAVMCYKDSQTRAIVLAQYFKAELIEARNSFLVDILSIYSYSIRANFKHTVAAVPPDALFPYLTLDSDGTEEGESRQFASVLFFYNISKVPFGADLIYSNAAILNSLIINFSLQRTNYQVTKFCLKTFMHTLNNTTLEVNPKIFLENDCFKSLCELINEISEISNTTGLDFIAKALSVAKIANHEVFEEMTKTDELYQMVDEFNNSRKRHNRSLISRIYEIIEE